MLFSAEIRMRVATAPSSFQETAEIWFHRMNPVSDQMPSCRNRGQSGY